MLLNTSHLNLTKLSHLCDDTFFVNILRWPIHGIIMSTFDAFKLLSGFSSMGLGDFKPLTLLSTDQNYDKDYNMNVISETNYNSIQTKMPISFFDFDKSLIYQHQAQKYVVNDSSLHLTDELILQIYSFREKQKRSSPLKIVLQFSILLTNIEEKV